MVAEQQNTVFDEFRSNRYRQPSLIPTNHCSLIFIHYSTPSLLFFLSIIPSPQFPFFLSSSSSSRWLLFLIGPQSVTWCAECEFTFQSFKQIFTCSLFLSVDIYFLLCLLFRSPPHPHFLSPFAAPHCRLFTQPTIQTGPLSLIFERKKMSYIWQML